MKNRVLVTGATGFLGSWTVERLLDSGWDVVSCLNPGSRKSSESRYHHRQLWQRCREAHSDLMDFSAVQALLDDVCPDAIVHMAALSDVTVAMQNPRATFQTSATISANIFEAVRLANRRVPIISHTTDKVYGTNPVPFTEGMPLRPFHVYEVAKAAQDQLGQFYGQQYAMPIVTVRCGNYFGPEDYNFNRIVPYVIRQVLRDEPITLRSNGLFTRDFLYIEDAAELNLMLLSALGNGQPGLNGEAFNFSLEVQMTVRALIECICKLMGAEPRIHIEGSAIAEIADMRLDCAKARAAFGWVPNYPLEVALRRTINAYKEYLQPELSASPA